MSPTNTPPVAILSGPETAIVGEEVFFDGSASYDPDPSGLKSWTLLTAENRELASGRKQPGSQIGVRFEADEVPETFVILTVVDVKGVPHTSAPWKVLVSPAGEHPVPVDCVWGPYDDPAWPDEWTDSGDGTESRSRTLTREEAIKAEHGGAPCEGDTWEVETQTRPIAVVDANCVLSETGTVVSETDLEVCQPDGFKAVKVVRRFDVVTPATGNGTCQPLVETIEKRACTTYVPPVPTPGVLSYPLRSNADVLKYAGISPYVTYDPAMDATKVIVPVWPVKTWALQAPISDTDTTIVLVLPTKDSAWPAHSLLFDDGEIVKVEGYSLLQQSTTAWLTTVRVLRGQRGTVASRHAIGATFRRNTNSLPTQLRVPLGSRDGHAYLIQWDFSVTDSFVGASNFVPSKSFQIESNSIWLEPQIETSGRVSDPNRCGAPPKGPALGQCYSMPVPGYDRAKHAGVFTFRSYNKPLGAAAWSPTLGSPYLHAGPAVLDIDPLAPMAGYKILEPNRWYRVFVYIEQRANDYDLVSAWIADRDTLTRLLDKVPLSVRPEGLQKFWVEHNSSDDNLYGLIDRVSYVRDIKMTTDPADVLSLLKKVGDIALSLLTQPQPVT